MFTVSIPLALGAVSFEPRLVLVLIGVMALMAAFAMWTLRCPSCGKLVMNRAFKLRGTTLEMPLGFPERRCSKCGRDLRA
jgi:hypothetical protein